ncbi:Endo-1,4-beta-glucanase [Chitinispirillum alkaliphilum]|nr:Endo-1,4-beta-glucanase [Chitinispirillum alkaliphilum]
MGRDLTGGWHDCGDYIKFHVTGPYAAYMYLYGYDNFPEIYPDNYSQAYSAPPSNGIPDVLDEVKIQTDYLIRTVNGNRAYWQIGDMRDHNVFTDAITNSNQNLYNGSHIRPVYSATSGRSNAFGDAASALALMSIVYREFDEEYADKCLKAAIEYYNIATTNPSNTADADNSAYNWKGRADWEDNVGLAAITLYRATGEAAYRNAAIQYANPLSEWRNFEYGEMHHILFLELYRVTNNNMWLNRVSNWVNRMELQPCGYHHNTNWGSLRNAGNAALLAALYHMYTGDQDAYDFAKRNVDFILGSHDGFKLNDSTYQLPKNFSFLIGYNELGGGYPQFPHHAAAFGKSSNAWGKYWEEEANPGTHQYEFKLLGGLAGGPQRPCSLFIDNIDDYVSSEYCIYYNAAFTGAVAYINLIENDENRVITSNNASVASGFSLNVNSRGDLNFNVPGKDNYSIALYQMNGKRVKTVVNEMFQAGSHTLSIETGRLPSGVYLVRLRNESESVVARMHIGR